MAKQDGGQPGLVAQAPSGDAPQKLQKEPTGIERRGSLKRWVLLPPCSPTRRGWAFAPHWCGASQPGVWDEPSHNEGFEGPLEWEGADGLNGSLSLKRPKAGPTQPQCGAFCQVAAHRIQAFCAPPPSHPGSSTPAPWSLTCPHPKAH